MPPGRTTNPNRRGDAPYRGLDERDLEPLLRLLEQRCRAARAPRPGPGPVPVLLLATAVALLAGGLLAILLGAA